MLPVVEWRKTHHSPVVRDYSEVQRIPEKEKKYKWLQQHEISEQNRRDRRSQKKNHSGSVGMRVNGRFSGTVKEGENWWLRDRKLRQRVLLLLISGVRRRWREEIRPITRIIHKILDTDGTNLELSSKGTDVTKNCIVWPACVRAICPSWYGLVAKLHLWQELQIQLWGWGSFRLKESETMNEMFSIVFVQMWFLATDTKWDVT